MILKPMGTPGVAPAHLRAWTQEEDQLLLRLWETMTLKEVAARLRLRSPAAIQARMHRLRSHIGLQPKQKRFLYGPEDDGFIRQHCAGMPLKEIGRHLGRSACSIRNRGYILGVSFRKLGDAHHSTKYSDEVVRLVRGLRDSEGPKLTFRQIGEKLEIPESAAHGLHYQRYTADEKCWLDMLPK